MDQKWLLERAMAFLEALMEERLDDRLVHLPPEGASLAAIERAALVTALHRANWVQHRAARLLDITPRVMNYKIKIHRITPPTTVKWKRGKEDVP